MMARLRRGLVHGHVFLHAFLPIDLTEANGALVWLVNRRLELIEHVPPPSVNLCIGIFGVDVGLGGE